MTAYRFTDPVDGATCVAHFGAAPGVQHPGCPFRATVHPDFDAYYCRECGRNGRISGAWFIDLLEQHEPPAAEHQLDDVEWRCSCGEECWTPEAFVLHLAEVAFGAEDEQ